ncbi:MAG: response regulator [Methanoregula sp.]|jgi:chemotaxis family two-component system response regulator Rcp1|nr:response regulator [Methanoregula sp.]
MIENEKILKWSRPVEILLVDDNPADVALTQEAFLDNKLCNNLSIVNDGVEAMEFLLKKGQYASVPTPDIILLDLNMPRKDGREVLAEIKSDDELKYIPVVIMTVSKDDKDILESYRLHANCYVKKPVKFAEFVEVVRSLENFWFSVVTLPSKK